MSRNKEGQVRLLATISAREKQKIYVKKIFLYLTKNLIKSCTMKRMEFYFCYLWRIFVPNLEIFRQPWIIGERLLSRNIHNLCTSKRRDMHESATYVADSRASVNTAYVFLAGVSPFLLPFLRRLDSTQSDKQIYFKPPSRWKRGNGEFDYTTSSESEQKSNRPRNMENFSLSGEKLWGLISTILIY